MTEQVSPYPLANPNDFSHLETEFSVLPPNLAEGYRQVEVQASRAFVAQFGEYLSAEQLTYFEGRQILFTDPEATEFFVNEWQEGIHGLSREDGSIDGYVYTGYEFEDPHVGRQVGAQGVERQATPAAQHLWAGRIVVHPIHEHEKVSVGAHWLMDSNTFFERTKSLDRVMDTMGSFYSSNGLAAIAVHEKVHGIQDWRLPLPIHEAAAYYYEREVCRENGWELPEVPRPMQAMADHYEACIAELGDDVHRLLFGNLEPESRDKILTALKERFSSAVIQELSQDQYGQVLTWKKIPVDEVEFPRELVA